MNPLEEATLLCPYCGEAVTVLVDCTAGRQDYIEDCQVCCRPIRLLVFCEDGVPIIEARSEND